MTPSPLRATTRLVLASLVLAVSMVSTATATSAQTPLCEPGEVPQVNRATGKMRCVAVGGTPGTPGGPGTGTPIGGGGGGTPWPPPGYVLVEWSSGGSEDDGTPCIERHSRWIPEENRPGYLDMYHLSFFRWYERLDYALLPDLTDCSAQPGEPALDPVMVQSLIESQLDLPDPTIDPGRGITGLRSYLDIGGPTAFDDRMSVTAPALTITVDATARYRVDWGDGSVETYSSSGGPYPDGDITHVYTSTGDYTVTVTPVWTVSWAGGGFAVDFTTELVASTVQLPVGEVQSVRTD